MESILVWYHCGHCRKLFQSDLGNDTSRVCEFCKKQPDTGLFHSVEKNEVVTKYSPLKEKVLVVGEKKKGRFGVVKIVLTWMIIMALALMVDRYFEALGLDEKKADIGALKMKLKLEAENENSFVEGALVNCHETFAKFIASPLKEKGQYIWNSEENASNLFESYYAGKYKFLDAGNIERIKQSVFKIDGESFIETRWFQDGLGEFEAVFREEDGEWKLDWKHFSRASKINWDHLIEDYGTVDGEFRIFAKNYTQDDSDEGLMKIAFFRGDFLEPLKVPEEPLVLEVDVKSDEGRLLNAAFALNKERESVFSRKNNNEDEADIIRVRVRLLRKRLENYFSLELKQVMACHWIDSDESGFNLSELKDELFSKK